MIVIPEIKSVIYAKMEILINIKSERGFNPLSPFLEIFDHYISQILYLDMLDGNNMLNNYKNI